MPMSTKRKAPAKLAAPITKSSAKRPTKNVIDESKTSVSAVDDIITNQSQVVNISSDDDSDEDISDAENGEEEETSRQVNGHVESSSKRQVNGKSAAADTADAASDDEEDTAPTFGELMRGNDVIDVPALLQQSTRLSSGLSQPTRKIASQPSNESLVTVLSQALRTDDVELLESCLQTTNTHTIQNTVEGLESHLAGTLLTNLCARLYRRPGRARYLLNWVHWTLIVHGGALASQPKVLHSLAGLQKVLAERAKGLNGLLVLKGKLELLEFQMDLRKRMRKPIGDGQDVQDDSEEDDVIYVEGETENAGDGANARTRRLRAGNLDDDDESDEGGLSLTNGIVGDSEDDEEMSGPEEDDSDDAEELLDEDEVQYDDDDASMGEEDESDGEAARPAKVQKVTRSASKRK